MTVDRCCPRCGALVEPVPRTRGRLVECAACALAMPAGACAPADVNDDPRPFCERAEREEDTP